MNFKRLTTASSAPISDYRNNFLTQFNTVLDDFFNQTFSDFSPVLADVGYPKFNAYRANVSGDEPYMGLVIDIAAPFVKREDIELDAVDSDNSLHVSVRNHQDKRLDDKAYYVKQIPRSSWRQTFTVDKNFPVHGAKADLKDGILTITIPSASSPVSSNKGRRVKIG